jgi:hypothetical protein
MTIIILFSRTVAATTSSSLLDAKSLALENSSSEGSSAEVYLEQSQFLSDPTNTSTSSAVTSMGVKFHHQASGTYSKTALVRAELALNEKRTPYVAVPELYLESRYDSPFFFNVGRKKRTWSRMDEQWNLGLWQALARWDYFKPESQGLIGAGAGMRTRDLGFEVFASPFFVPDQGPQFEVVDGRFESDNRWFWRPQTEIGIFEENSGIRYKLMRPPEQRVFNQPSFAGRFWAGRYQETPWLSLAYAYKPVNQFHLALDPNYELDTSEVGVAIYPEVVHHHIATFETGLGNQAVDGWLSFTREWPERPEHPDSFLQSSLEDNFWASASLSHSLGLGDFKVVWSYMKRWSLHEENHENLVGTQVESSYGRFPIDEAASLSWVGTLARIKNRRLRWKTQYWYSIPEQGAWLSSGLDFQATESLLWTLQADVIGTNLEDDDTRGLVSRYRSNDRVLAGVNYVF